MSFFKGLMWGIPAPPSPPLKSKSCKGQDKDSGEKPYSPKVEACASKARSSCKQDCEKSEVIAPWLMPRDHTSESVENDTNDLAPWLRTQEAKDLAPRLMKQMPRDHTSESVEDDTKDLAPWLRTQEAKDLAPWLMKQTERFRKEEAKKECTIEESGDWTENGKTQRHGTASSTRDWNLIRKHLRNQGFTVGGFTKLVMTVIG